MLGVLTNFLLARCEGLMDGLKAVSLWLLVILGVAIIGASIGVAFYLPLQFAAVMVASIGSVIGTAVGSLGFAQLVSMVGERKIAEAERQAKENLREKNEMVDRVKQVEKLEAEKAAMAKKIRRMERMHVNVDQFLPILKLCLLEHDLSFIDFCHGALNDDPIAMLEQAEHAVMPDAKQAPSNECYLGVLEVKFRARYGIDLNRLRFREDEDGVLVVSGIKSEFQGYLGLKKDWRLQEIRTYEKGWIWDTYTIKPEDPRLNSLTKRHDNYLQERINKGLHLEYLDASIKHLAKGLLSTLFPHKRLVFREHDELPSLTLEEYFDAHNRKLDGEDSRERILPP